MVGLILFGRAKVRSTLRSVRATERIVDDLKCFKSMEAIKEALIVSCAMTKTKKYGINVRNPSVEATLAPLSRSQDNYGARIFVNGTSRKKLESYARPYRVLLAVSQEVHQKLHYMAKKVQIYFHRKVIGIFVPLLFFIEEVVCITKDHIDSVEKIQRISPLEGDFERVEEEMHADEIVFVEVEEEDNKRKPIVVILVGAPGSGKSTFCDHVMRVSTRPWVRVCQ
ncbi:transcription factor bHLH140, partial [Tanacetum coccineum]